ncbi:hypothetical protein ACH4F6_24205, partial [Streptomyces sp. NPDC017936]
TRRAHRVTAAGATEFAATGPLPRIADGIGASAPQAREVVPAYALGVVVGLVRPGRGGRRRGPRRRA